MSTAFCYLNDCCGQCASVFSLSDDLLIDSAIGIAHINRNYLWICLWRVFLVFIYLIEDSHFWEYLSFAHNKYNFPWKQCFISVLSPLWFFVACIFSQVRLSDALVTTLVSQISVACHITCLSVAEVICHSRSAGALCSSGTRADQCFISTCTPSLNSGKAKWRIEHWLSKFLPGSDT